MANLPSRTTGDVAADHVADHNTLHNFHNLIDAAGDLIVGTGADTAGKLAKGSALDGLRVNAAGTALEWAASTAGLTAISEQVLGADAASVTFSSIPATYRHLMVFGSVRSTRSNPSDAMNIRLNGDTGANYYDQYFDAISTAVTAGADVAQTGGYFGRCAAATATAGRSVAVLGLIPDYRGTTFHKHGLGFSSGSFGTTAADQRLSHVGFTWANTAAVTSLTVYAAVGNLVAGSAITLYGLKGV